MKIKGSWFLIYKLPEEWRQKRLSCFQFPVDRRQEGSFVHPSQYIYLPQKKPEITQTTGSNEDCILRDPYTEIVEFVFVFVEFHYYFFVPYTRLTGWLDDAAYTILTVLFWIKKAFASCACEGERKSAIAVIQLL